MGGEQRGARKECEGGSNRARGERKRRDIDGGGWVG